jgi:hypothetical protein
VCGMRRSSSRTRRTVSRWSLGMFTPAARGGAGGA